MTIDADPQRPHPLDPLTVTEVAAATALWRESGVVPEDCLVHVCSLYEPPKGELAAAAEPVDRRVRYLVRSPSTGSVHDLIVSVTRGEVIEAARWSDGHPPYLLHELLGAIGAVMEDERFLDGCRRRGVEDMSQLQLDPWPAGRFGAPWEVRDDGRIRRVARVVGYWREDVSDNGYAHPLDGLIATVDLDDLSVVDVLDEDPRPFPRIPNRYDREHGRTPRGTARPIEITQPSGVSFTLESNHVSWEKWRFRFTVHPVTGLVIHNVTYDGRSIAHRLGLSEMVVPYAGQGPSTHWKNTFDAGELSMGVLVNSLALGCDCLGDITYVDAVFADAMGNPQTIPQAVCLHEEDAGIAWKHTDLHSGNVEVRRARRFVVNSVITAGNYEYAFRWMFSTDGKIQLEVQLTGIVQTEIAEPDGTAPASTRLIMPGLAASHHQHLFSARLDLDIDGEVCSVAESDIVPTRDAGLHTWEQQDTVLARADGGRALTAGRHWKVTSSTRRNAVGEPTAYELVPVLSLPLLADESTSVARRAGFARQALWVTPYDPSHLHAASDMANLHEGGAGLPEWGTSGADLVDTDVVLWHTFGSTHVVRPEDWPVMPVETTGFTLRPLGFFDENPALDIDPPDHCHH